MRTYKANDRIFELTDNIYCQDITIIIGGEDIFKKWCKKKNVKFEESNLYAETGEVSADGKLSSFFYVRIPKFENCSLDMAIAAHEILHATFRVMKAVGFKFKYGNTEPINYYFEMLYKDFLEKIYK